MFLQESLQLGWDDTSVCPSPRWVFPFLPRTTWRWGGEGQRWGSCWGAWWCVGWRSEAQARSSSHPDGFWSPRVPSVPWWGCYWVVIPNSEQVSCAGVAGLVTHRWCVCLALFWWQWLVENTLRSGALASQGKSMELSCQTCWRCFASYLFLFKICCALLRCKYCKECWLQLRFSGRMLLCEGPLFFLRVLCLIFFLFNTESFSYCRGLCGGMMVHMLCKIIAR